MAKEILKKKIEGELVFKGNDKLMVRMEMTRSNDVRSNRIVTFGPSILPADFDPEKMKVTGKFSFEIVTEPK
jgi:hypothetical protein